MKRDNWRFEALARAKIIHQEEEERKTPLMEIMEELMIICENFKNCQDPALECPHQYPHESGEDCSSPFGCDQAEGKIQCLQIILKEKGEKDV